MRSGVNGQGMRKGENGGSSSTLCSCTFGFENISPAIDAFAWVMGQFDPEDVDDLVAEAREQGAPWQLGLVLGLMCVGAYVGGHFA